MQLTKRFIYTVFSLLLLQGIAFPGTATLSWQANTEADLQGYNVYYGTAPRSYEPPIPVGNTTAHTFDNLVDDQTYYFAVTALDNNGNESGYSAEVSKTIPPASGDPGTVAVSVSTPAGYEVDTVGLESVAVYTDRTYWFTQVPQKYIGLPFIRTANSDRSNTSSSFLTFSTHQPAAVYVCYSSAAASVPNWLSSQFVNTGETIDRVYHTWNVWQGTFPAGSVTLGGNMAAGADGDSLAMYIVMVGPAGTAPQDTVAPTVSITAPTTGNTFATTSSVIDLAGTAADNAGISQVSWSNPGLGSGTATGTAAWSASGIPLQAGENAITVTAVDLAGNQAQTGLTVTYTPLDTAAPVVAITSPVDTGQYATGSGTIVLAGTAQDDQSVEAVTWSSSAGGSGTAEGTNAWTTPAISLAQGLNTLTITATDAAGNTSRDTISVTYTLPDATAPTVAITDPAVDPFETTQNTIRIAGTASDNQGVTQVAWHSSTGASGSAAGTTQWSVSTVALQAGSNTITITAADAAGNTGTESVTVVYTQPDVTAPVIQITEPTSGGSYASTQRSITLSGTASDNAGLDRVTWTSSAGGSGTAVGADSWTISGINLAEGTTVITVTATDDAGNSASDSLSVTYAPAADTIDPEIRITSPTTGSYYFARSSSVTIGGTASDNASIASVTWRNSNGASGVCSGTTNWQAAGIPLERYWNTITVTAFDTAGNTTEQTLRVFRWR